MISFAAPLKSQNDVEKQHFSAVLDAFTASDSAKEQNLFCRGVCHLAKFSHRLTSVDIEDMGARTLLEVIASVPGMVVKKDHVGRPTLGIYGLLGQSRMQILIDGVRHNDPYDGSAILNLPAAIIDFIDIYYGPGGTWFGEGSLAGVVAIFTKSLPELRQFSHFSSDKSLLGGFMAIIKRNRIKTGAFASFSVLDPSDHFLSTTRPPIEPTIHQFSLKNISTSGFFDFKISNTAQAHVLVRTSLSQEFLGPNFDYGFGSFRHNKFAWISDIHLLKKRAQKNVLDLFFSTGVFRASETIRTSPTTNTDNRITDKYSGLRFELGTKFHLKPFHGHDLFFGVGGILQGVSTGQHLISNDEDSDHAKSQPMLFSFPPRIFGRPSALFIAPTGHMYGFIQDEWQIRAPILLTVGSRIILPVESPNFSATLLPNLAAVLIPINKLRFTIAFQTSTRTATIYEQSDRLADAMATKTPVVFSPILVEPENSRTLEASVWYGDFVSDLKFKTSLGAHLSQITDAVSTKKAASLNNDSAIDIAGVRSVSEMNFSGGHAYSLGIYYSRAFRRDQTNRSWGSCLACLVPWVNESDGCRTENAVPRLMLRTSVKLDLASFGGINLATAFIGQSAIDDLVSEPQTVFEIAYLSKVLWRYVLLFASAKATFLGHQYRINHRDMNIMAPNYSPSLLATFGFSIGL